MPENKNIVPLEILLKIFSYLHKRQQLDLVCKAWYIAANCHYGEVAEFCVRETELAKFLMDLKLYNRIANKVKVLRVYVDGHGHSSYLIRDSLGSILELCTNMIYFKFRTCDITCSTAIREVIDSPLHLPEIQRFKITDYRPFLQPSIDAMYITVKLAFKLHQSLTRLYLVIDTGYCVKAIKDASGLSQLLGGMPCLKQVNIKNIYPLRYAPKLDMVPLLLTASNLETVIFRNLEQRLGSFLTVNKSSFSSIQMLRLQVKHLHPKILQFVMLKFNNLQDIEIRAKKGLESSRVVDMFQLLDDFRVYCNQISFVNVSFTYLQNQSFLIQRGD